MTTKALILAVVAVLVGGVGTAAVWGQIHRDAAEPAAPSAPEVTATATAAQTPDFEASATTSTSAEELFPDEQAWTGSPAINDRCTPLAQPARRSKAWFTRPGSDGPPPLARAVRKLICTAAPGSTMRIAMYFLKEDSPDVESIVRAMEIVATKRDVSIEIVLDGSPYAKGTPVHKATLDRLDDIGAYYLCPYGCRSQDTRTLPNGKQSTELQHNKFVVITDTIWNTRLDPLVIQSSANWSASQLSTRHQSAVMIHDDPVLAKHFDVRWESLVACAAPDSSCAEWNDGLDELGLDPAQYSVDKVDGVWFDRDLAAMDGTTGRGIQVLFSPWAHADPIGADLGVYDCEGEHNRVWVAHLFISRFRPDVINGLADLMQRGCDVRIIVSSFDRVHNSVGILMMRDAGLRVSCVSKVHDKIVLVDAVNRNTGKAEKALWIGSHSFGYDALRAGDEALLRLTDDVPGARERADNRALWQEHRDQWTFLKARTTACPA